MNNRPAPSRSYFLAQADRRQASTMAGATVQAPYVSTYRQAARKVDGSRTWAWGATAYVAGAEAGYAQGMASKAEAVAAVIAQAAA